MSQTKSNLSSIKQQIAAIAATAGRDPLSVRLVAVSKTHSSAEIVAAYHAGQTIFGENYVQELVAKALVIKEPVEWHFIGHLQSNKVRQIASIVTTIHSVDRLSLAQEISRQYRKIGKTCQILLQVNVAGESTKSGTTVEGVMSLIREISGLPHIAIIGLMTMPPFFDDPDRARPYFAQLRLIAEKIRSKNIDGVAMNELSMGMSGDFSTAIQEGATLVRIGTAIFGKRY